MSIDIMPFRLEHILATIAGYAETGVPLIARVGGTLQAAGFSDDPGLYFVVPLIARTLGVGAETAYRIFVLGCVVGAACIGGLGLALLSRSWRSRAYAALVVAVLSAGALRIADVYTVAFAYPLAFVPWLVWLLRRPQSARVELPLFLALTGAAGAAAHLVRSHAATSMLLFVVVSLALAPSMPRRSRIAGILAFLLGSATVLGAFGVLLDRRDAYLESHVPRYVPTPVGHPFWHSAYLGLAYLDNPYVSAWDDRVAQRRAAELAPDVPYLSEEYERVLRSEYLRIVRHDPWFAVRTYGAKLAVAILRALVCFGLGTIALVRRRPPWALIAAFGAAIAFETLPSLMTMPFHPYMLGLYTWAGTFGAVCVAYASEGATPGGSDRNTHSVAST